MQGSGARFSIVVPVHNEETMLPKTIQSVYNLRPEEVFFCLDRCTDGTEEIVKRWADAYAGRTVTTIRRYTDADGAGWRFRGGFLRRDAYARARNDTIVNTSADLRLCPSIAHHVEDIPRRYALVSFHYYENPWTIQCFERAIINKFLHGFSGLLALSREAWLDSEDIEDLKQVERGEDTHLKLAMLKKHPTHHAHTHSLHLRPNETMEDHYNRGLAIHAQLHHTPIRVFIHSIMLLRPAVFTGYMHARTLKKMKENDV